MTAVATRLPQLDLLWADASALGAPADALDAAYGGELRVPRRADRPTVIVNFVSTLDGVVSYATPEAAGGGEISGFFGPDRFVMGLLRAHADAVLVGAGTVRASPRERWTPDDIYPDAATEFAALRSRAGLAPQPTTVVVTGSGRLDPDHPGLADPTIPVIVAGGAIDQPRGHVETLRATSVERIVGELGRRGMRLVLCEGGPHLLGRLLEAELVDELFLTLAPQLAGRTELVARLALVEVVAFGVTDAPWWDLVAISRVDHHLFLRYRRRTPQEA
jgi:riboflavin biosynthesis pyrimidine reductase